MNSCCLEVRRSRSGWGLCAVMGTTLIPGLVPPILAGGGRSLSSPGGACPVCDPHTRLCRGRGWARPPGLPGKAQGPSADSKASSSSSSSSCHSWSCPAGFSGLVAVAAVAAKVTTEASGGKTRPQDSPKAGVSPRPGVLPDPSLAICPVAHRKLNDLDCVCVQWLETDSYRGSGAQGKVAWATVGTR